MAIIGPTVPYSKFLTKMRKVKMHLPNHTISVQVFDGFINNVLPKNPSCKDCREHDLARLSYLGKFRDDGLLLGRYTGVDGPLIRTYPVTANNSWVRNYAKKAFNAAIRGKKLNGSTPLKHMKHKVTNNVHFDSAIASLANVK